MSRNQPTLPPDQPTAVCYRLAKREAEGRTGARTRANSAKSKNGSRPDEIPTKPSRSCYGKPFCLCQGESHSVWQTFLPLPGRITFSLICATNQDRLNEICFNRRTISLRCLERQKIRGCDWIVFRKSHESFRFLPSVACAISLRRVDCPIYEPLDKHLRPLLPASWQGSCSNRTYR